MMAETSMEFLPKTIRIEKVAIETNIVIYSVVVKKKTITRVDFDSEFLNSNNKPSITIHTKHSPPLYVHFQEYEKISASYLYSRIIEELGWKERQDV